MAGYHRSLDVYQGYNYRKDKQTPVGFITKLEIGGTELEADQTCKDPTNPTEDLEVVAVLSGVLWEMGVTDKVYLSGQISIRNRQAVSLLAINSLDNLEVLFQLSVYERDPLARQYFLAFTSKDTDMKGRLEARGEELNLSVADEASTEVQSPENYAFQIGIEPQPTAQTLHIATSDQKSVAKSWGLAVR